MTLKPAQPGKAGLFIRSLVFFMGLVLSVLIWGPTVALTFPLPFERRYRAAQYWSRFVIRWLRITCRIDYRVSGLENIPKTPAVLLVKHQSTWETIFLHQFLPPLTWVVKRELLWMPCFGWALAQMDPIAIHRKTAASALKEVARKGEQRLVRGRWVLIFPEGTRTAPGEHRAYGASGALLAVNSGYPVLPVAHNAGEFWPRRGFLKYPGTVQVVFGPLLPSRGRKAKELNALVESWIESAMARIGQGSSARPLKAAEALEPQQH